MSNAVTIQQSESTAARRRIPLTILDSADGVSPEATAAFHPIIFKGGYSPFNSPQTITGATNATPIVLPSTAHNLNVGDVVYIATVLGNTAANGYRIVKATPDANHFSITDTDGVDVAGNGAYVSGGTWELIGRPSVNATVKVWLGEHFLEADPTTELDVVGLGRVCAIVSGALKVIGTFMVVPYDPWAAGPTTTDIATAIGLDVATTEPVGPPTATGTLRAHLRWVVTHFRNKMTNNGTLEKLYADDGSTVIGTRTVSDSGGTTTKGEVA